MNIKKIKVKKTMTKKKVKKKVTKTFYPKFYKINQILYKFNKN